MKKNAMIKNIQIHIRKERFISIFLRFRCFFELQSMYLNQALVISRANCDPDKSSRDI